MIRFLKVIYGSLGLRYLVKQYFFLNIAIAMQVAAIADMYGSEEIAFKPEEYKVLTVIGLYLLISYILYPFAKYALDSFSNILFGGYLVGLSIWLLALLLIFKFIVILITFYMAPIIAVPTIIYLYFTNRNII